MKITESGRSFATGRSKNIVLTAAKISIGKDEVVTFVTEDGAEYDVTRKNWGFYATPSINGRLSSFGFTAFLAINPLKKLFVLLRENGKEEEFNTYLASEEMQIVCRLDEIAEKYHEQNS